MLNEESNAVLEIFFLNREGFTDSFFIFLGFLNSTAAEFLGS
jgi:hypothetical protein